MIGQPNQSTAIRRLGDLRRSQPTDPTLKNLLGVLTTKLELCSRLPVCEWEADHEGDTACAEIFRRLAEDERRSCGEILDSLRLHLDRRAELARGGAA